MLVLCLERAAFRQDAYLFLCLGKIYLQRGSIAPILVCELLDDKLRVALNNQLHIHGATIFEVIGFEPSQLFDGRFESAAKAAVLGFVVGRPVKKAPHSDCPPIKGLGPRLASHGCLSPD